MMTETPSTRDHFSNAMSDPSFEYEIAQIRAQTALLRLTGDVPDYRWSVVASRVIRNATAALFDLQMLAPTMGTQGDDELSELARRLGQLWESLGDLDLGAARGTSLVNAALAYEIAGYQANAAYLAKILVPDRDEEHTPSFEEITAAFIRRQFLRTIGLARTLSSQPPRNSTEPTGLATAAAIALAARGLEAASRFFLSGEARLLDQATTQVALARQGFGDLGLTAEHSLTGLLLTVLPFMRARSAWTVLASAMADTPLWSRYLTLLARGVGQDVFKSSGINELWPSQLRALDHGLLVQAGSVVVRLPTSAGKTRIAELAIVHSLLSQPGSLCLYVAPYRALASELLTTFTNLFVDLGMRVSYAEGAHETDEMEQTAIGQSDLVIITPEKLDLQLRATPTLLDRVALIIVDEGHILDDPSRGARFEFLLTRIKRRRPSARFVFLSAVISDQSLKEVSQWLNRDGDDASPERRVTVSNWRPAIQRLAQFEWRGDTGVLRYERDTDFQHVAEFVPGVIRSKTFNIINPKTGRRNRHTLPETGNKSQTAAELALQFAPLGPVLVFCPQPRLVESVGRAIAKRLTIGDLDGQARLPFLTTPTTLSAAVADDWLGPTHDTSLWLKTGVALHHGEMPEPLRSAVEKNF